VTDDLPTARTMLPQSGANRAATKAPADLRAIAGETLLACTALSWLCVKRGDCEPFDGRMF
jgi:hypothetical protein